MAGLITGLNPYGGGGSADLDFATIVMSANQSGLNDGDLITGFDTLDADQSKDGTEITVASGIITLPGDSTRSFSLRAGFYSQISGGLGVTQVQWYLAPAGANVAIGKPAYLVTTTHTSHVNSTARAIAKAAGGTTVGLRVVVVSLAYTSTLYSDFSWAEVQELGGALGS